MLLIKYVVVIAAAIVPFCYAEVRSSQRLRRDADVSTLQKIFDILRTQDEKINRLHTVVVTNQFLPKCTAALKSGHMSTSTKCWKDLITDVKIYDQSVATEIKLLGNLINDAYDGEKSRLPKIAQFIKNNADKGSELANGGYTALLNAMDKFDQLYMKKIATDNGLGGGLIDYTYRTLIKIRKAEGESSQVFTHLLPSVLNSILSGKEVFIRNSVTKDIMHASSGSSNDNITKLLVSGGGNEHDSRYIWKLKPVESRWKDHNQELFYIENASDNKILAVSNIDGSLILAEATDERMKSTWAMFYIRLVRGSTGQEVVIQCSYWGIKTLVLSEENNKKTPRLLSSKSLDEIPTGIWLLQPKVE